MVKIGTLLIGLGAAWPALAQSSPEAITYASCAVCHGSGGDRAIPAIAGRPADEVQAELTKFAAGEAGSTIMHRFAVALTPAEIEGLARYVSGLKEGAK